MLDTNTPATEYLDRKGTAKLLRVSPRTIISWEQRGLLPFIRIGRTIRFRLDLLNDALSRMAAKPVNRS